MAFFLIVDHILLLYHLAFLIEEILFEILHDSDVIYAVVSSIIHWVSLFIHLNSLTSLILDSLFLNSVSEKKCKLILILLDPPLHTRVPVILDSIIGSTLKQVGDVSPLVGLVSVQ